LGLPLSPLKKRKLYDSYSYLIRRDRHPARGSSRSVGSGNFLTYAYRAARKLDAPEIKGQVRGHWRMLQREIRR